MNIALLMALTVSMVTVERDVSLEVVDWGGQGRPIVLLAGLGNTAHVFDEFAPRLTAAPLAPMASVASARCDRQPHRDRRARAPAADSGRLAMTVLRQRSSAR